jgi:hypothetical protein
MAPLVIEPYEDRNLCNLSGSTVYLRCRRAGKSEADTAHGHLLVPV